MTGLASEGRPVVEAMADVAVLYVQLEDRLDVIPWWRPLLRRRVRRWLRSVDRFVVAELSPADFATLRAVLEERKP